MKEKIPEFLKSRKGKDVALVLIVVLTGALSFGLGRLSVGSQAGAATALYTLAPPAPDATVAAASVEARPASVAETGTYVGSRNGSVYHLPWCSGAKRINEENKIWFATKADAEQAGYRPAGNCKGL